MIPENGIERPLTRLATERPVVLIHGIFDTAAKLEPMVQFLNDLGFRPFAPTLAPSDGAVGLDELALQLRFFVDEHIPEGRFDLIGFSMGGLIGRYYLQRLGGIERVRRFISVSSPHRGSYWAYTVNNAGCRQMRPGSEFLRGLNRDAKTLARVSFASLWTPMDLMIVPSWSSRLGVGEEYRLPVAVHPWMLRNRRSLRLIAKLLDASTASAVSVGNKS
jgi:triacylglycerol lipase